MDYKEMWIEQYDMLQEDLGREPTLDEIRNMELNLMDDLVLSAEAWEDR